MGLLGWFRQRRGIGRDPQLMEWRHAWTEALESADKGAPARLEAVLTSLGRAEDDVEIEREMLDGLEHLVALRERVDAHGLPVMETGHRVVGTDVCHFSAPASLPDDPLQPGGRVILTNIRAIFAGGARSIAVPWHSVTDVVQSDRDVLVAAAGRETLHRFRFNSFADALCSAFLARRLMPPRAAGRQRTKSASRG